jgi:hypothetical protein
MQINPMAIIELSVVLAIDIVEELLVDGFQIFCAGEKAGCGGYETCALGVEAPG